MRQRDYLFPEHQCEQVQDQILSGFVDGHNVMIEAVGTKLEGYLGTDKDPMPVIRAWRSGLIQLHRMVDEMTPDSLGKLWHAAKLNELTRDTRKLIRWKAAALNLNPESRDIDIALSGMAPWHDGEKWLLAIPIRAPEPLAANYDYEPDDLILLDPKTGAASVYGDAASLLFLPMEEDRFTVHADARTWAREFATARVEWIYGKFHAQKVANITPTWIGLPPSALLIGAMDKVRWPTGAVITAGVGIDARKLQYAIYDQSRTSRVHQPQQNIGRNAA